MLRRLCESLQPLSGDSLEIFGLETLCRLFGNSLETLWRLSGDSLETFWRLFGDILEILWRLVTKTQVFPMSFERLLDHGARNIDF